MKTLKEIVSGGKMAEFVKFKNNCLIYETDCGLEFPIPATDLDGQAELHSVESAMSLMKWIRKQLELINSSKEQNV
jgi:hypothetical protein